MTNHAQVKAIAEQFLHALDINDASNLPLSQDVKYTSALQTEPLEGESDVRAYILDISPFIVDVCCTNLIIEDGSVAALTELTTVNGVKSHGAYIIEVEHGSISSIVGLFDTRLIFAGSAK